jgi:hypothetical protein
LTIAPLTPGSRGTGFSTKPTFPIPRITKAGIIIVEEDFSPCCRVFVAIDHLFIA